jgi:hypothetical protein
LKFEISKDFRIEGDMKRLGAVVTGAVMVAGVLLGVMGQTPVQVVNRAVTFNLSYTSPAAASTVAQTDVRGLGAYHSLSIYSNLQGTTGGTLDVYLQYSPDGGTTFVDYAHFPQLAAGAAAATRVWNVTKLAQQTTLTTVGTGTNPALAANSILGGDWGDRLRVLSVAGAGTTAGAGQTIIIVGTP